MFDLGGPPVPGRINPLDPPDDYFRIRLISTILETCGMFFNKGAAGKKLDYFLSFFQYYIHTKNPLPMDIEFLVQDIFSLTRPQWKLASNLEEASKVFQLAVAQDQKTAGLDKGAEQDDGSNESSSEDENADEDQDDNEDDVSEDAEAEVCPTTPTPIFVTQTNWVRLRQEHEQNPPYSSDEFEAEIVVTRQEEEIDPEDEADFEREYAKMMAESLESRKSERKQQFDLPLPVRPKAREHTAGGESADGVSESPGATMAFSLLTKKGNRQQVRAHCRPPYAVTDAE
jgi:regulator of nonsense transcripts 2